MMAREKREVILASVAILIRVFMSVLIVYIDYLLTWILDVIYRNSRIEYHQTGCYAIAVLCMEEKTRRRTDGEHYVNVTVTGTGFMAEIVRMFLSTFNTHHTLDSISTSESCLPRAERQNIWKTGLIFAVYLLVICFIFTEAYGLRVRRSVCGFFYRKREKRRVLYLYNELLKKRKGYLIHMRHRVRKEVRERTLRDTTGVFTSLKLHFPKLCYCLKWLSVSKDKCIICRDPENQEFIRCKTIGCGWSHCRECWVDVSHRCYACGGKENGESASDPSDEDDGFGSSDTSDLTNDEQFLS